MSWNKARRRWRVSFKQVKLPWPGFRDRAPFDELYLTLFSPDSLYIIKHDLQTGVSAAGKRTGISGHDIEVTGASGQECWQTARSQMLDKFLAPGRCELVAQIDLSGVEVRNWQRNQMEGMTSRQDDAYQGIPLKHMTPRSRGLCIEEIAFELDQTSLQRSLSQRNSSVSSAFGHRCGSASFACHSEQQSSPHRPKALGFYLPKSLPPNSGMLTSTCRNSAVLVRHIVVVITSCKSMCQPAAK